MADSEDEVDLHAGLSLPTLGGGGGSSAAPLSDDDDDDEAPKEQGAGEDSDAEPGSGLPNADAAFTVDGSAYELDPFRIAGPSSAAGATEAGPSASTGPAGAGKLCSKLFVAGLPYDLDDAGLIKAFSRYGKVQEASVARAEGGKSRGFGFVTYVHLKGARFCMEQLGDPPVFEIGGRSCTVRFSEARSSGPAHYRMPARGQYDPAPRRSGAEAKAPGGPPAPKRVHEEGEARLTVRRRFIFSFFEGWAGRLTVRMGFCSVRRSARRLRVVLRGGEVRKGRDAAHGDHGGFVFLSAEGWAGTRRAMCDYGCAWRLCFCFVISRGGTEGAWRVGGPVRAPARPVAWVERRGGRLGCTIHATPYPSIFKDAAAEDRRTIFPSDSSLPLCPPRRPPQDVGADGGDFEGGDGYGGGGKAKRKKKKKEEIVTVSKRQDAEPLYDKKLTMKELFSKEFWRI
jgi:hypothetical protein